MYFFNYSIKIAYIIFILYAYICIRIYVRLLYKYNKLKVGQSGLEWG